MLQEPGRRQHAQAAEAAAHKVGGGGVKQGRRLLSLEHNLPNVACPAHERHGVARALLRKWKEGHGQRQGGARLHPLRQLRQLRLAGGAIRVNHVVYGQHHIVDVRADGSNSLPRPDVTLAKLDKSAARRQRLQAQPDVVPGKRVEHQVDLALRCLPLAQVALKGARVACGADAVKAKLGQVRALGVRARRAADGCGAGMLGIVDGSEAHAARCSMDEHRLPRDEARHGHLHCDLHTERRRRRSMVPVPGNGDDLLPLDEEARLEAPGHHAHDPVANAKVAHRRAGANDAAHKVAAKGDVRLGVEPKGDHHVAVV